MAVARSSLQYTGVQAVNPPELQFAHRAPSSADKAFQKGTLWLDLTGLAAYQWPGSGNWITLGSGTTGAIVSITGDSGGAEVPLAGNFSLLGTANQITVAGSANTETFSLSATLVAPGSLTVTSGFTVSAGTSSLKATTIVGTTLINASGAAATTIGTGGTGAVNIGNATGNTAVTGSLTASTSLTATAGDITATLGNVVLNGAAKQLQVHGGAATDFIGTATLVNGAATVLNTNIAATDRIFTNRSAVNASTALGVFKVVKTAGVNFVITACKPADATTETGDVSTVEYFIVRQV